MIVNTLSQPRLPSSGVPQHDAWNQYIVMPGNISAQKQNDTQFLSCVIIYYLRATIVMIHL